MNLIFSIWPRHWSRTHRSAATAALGCVLVLLVLWLIGIPLAKAPDPIGENAQQFVEGTRTTVLLSVVAGLFGVLIGILAGAGRVSSIPPLRWIAGFYIWILRGTPLLVQIMFVFFALPDVAMWIFHVLHLDRIAWVDATATKQFFTLSEFSAACMALALNVGAYNAEAIRAGLQAIPKGQLEAAKTLGLSRWHTFIHVTMPQAFKVSLPPLVNNFVALLKDSSLAYSIGVVELTNMGNRVQSATFMPVPVLITTALIYLTLTTVLTVVSNAIEHYFDIEGRIV